MRKPSGGTVENGRHMKREADSRLKLSTQLQVNVGGMSSEGWDCRGDCHI